jgi:hypothetical protein
MRSHAWQERASGSSPWALTSASQHSTASDRWFCGASLLIRTWLAARIATDPTPLLAFSAAMIGTMLIKIPSPDLFYP